MTTVDDTCEYPNFVYFCGSHIGNLVRILVSIPMNWDQSVNSQLIQEVSTQQVLSNIYRLHVNLKMIF
jgi:hypothetical protein